MFCFATSDSRQLDDGDLENRHPGENSPIAHRIPKPLFKEGLFAAKEREIKLNKLGDILSILREHIDLAAFTAGIDAAAP